MKFSSDSIKLKSKTQNEDFCFDLETQRGHFFALLDFGPHDYANLNATLRGKLETIVGSFVSLSRFSAELFLGFLAKEINNFLHNLGEQSSGPELLASGALCLVSGNRLTYFLSGDVRLTVVNNGRLLPLHGTAAEPAPGKNAAAIERLGARNQEGPLTDVVQSFTLQDADLVLLMTNALHEALGDDKLVEQIAAVGSTDAGKISAALLQAGAAAPDDRTLVVMTGPYEKYVDPVMADLSKAVTTLESKVDAISSGDADQRVSQQLEILKDDLRAKAAKIDLLELDEKVKKLSEQLARSANATATANEANLLAADESSIVREERVKRSGMPVAAVALLVLAAAILGSLIGGWMQSRRAQKTPEVWSVKTSGNQISVSRLDGEQATVTLNVAQPLNAVGEQKFSTFADAKRYIDTLTQAFATATPDTSGANKNGEAVTEITVKPGDSLKRFAQQYNVPEEKIIALNPSVTRWPMIQIGQKILVPATAAAAPTITPVPGPTAAPSATAAPTPPITTAAPVAAPSEQPVAANLAANTTEITVGPGDSINRLAQRYNATPNRLRELNPRIKNWGAIHVGQRIVVPAQPAG